MRFSAWSASRTPDLIAGHSGHRARNEVISPCCEDMKQGMSGVGSEERAERADREGDAALGRGEPDLLSADGDGPNDAVAAPSVLASPKLLIQTGLVVLLLIVGIYFLLPKIVGIQGTLSRLGDASPAWLVVAFAMDVAAYLSYVALFRGVVGRGLGLRLREAYEVTMSGLAASLLFSAGGAGGVVLNYWAIRKAGMEAGRAACRLVAFLVLLYGVYVSVVIINGILLSAGVLSGPNPPGLTVVPAGIAGLVVIVFLLIA